MTKGKTSLVVGLIVLVLFQGISGIAGGFGLIGDPSGKTLRIPLEWLQGSPFSDYLIPGIILFTILGLFPFVISYGLIKRKVWGWHGSVVLGLALIIWIIVEIMVIGYQADPPLQLIYGLVGIMILFTSLTPQVKSHFKITTSYEA